MVILSFNRHFQWFLKVPKLTLNQRRKEKGNLAFFLVCIFAGSF
jgi:hypothetical protein